MNQLLKLRCRVDAAQVRASGGKGFLGRLVWCPEHRGGERVRPDHQELQPEQFKQSGLVLPDRVFHFGRTIGRQEHPQLVVGGAEPSA